ncbi:MAG: calcium/proton exchanger, partial [Blastocatellia bacterium]
FHARSEFVFFSSAIAIVVLAEWMRRGTEEMAKRAGGMIGGLLSVTFGNVAELILALFVLKSGNVAVVKATITGSIISNSLLGLGIAILAGSWGRRKQTFSRERVGLLSSLYIISLIALMLPALFDYTERKTHVGDPSRMETHLSLGVAIVLIAVYVANLIYTMVTHRDLFSAGEHFERPTWSLAKTLLVLGGATVFVAIESELVSQMIDKTAVSLGMTEFFLGIIILPIIGNAAEYVSAIYFARTDQMNMVMSIAVGASIQVALLTAPVLVIASYIIGWRMDLVFENPLELLAIAGAAFAVKSISQDGETDWFEGLLLVAVYLLLAITFFYVT